MHAQLKHTQGFKILFSKKEAIQLILHFNHNDHWVIEQWQTFNIYLKNKIHVVILWILGHKGLWIWNGNSGSENRYKS